MGKFKAKILGSAGSFHVPYENLSLEIRDVQSKGIAKLNLLSNKSEENQEKPSFISLERAREILTHVLGKFGSAGEPVLVSVAQMGGVTMIWLIRDRFMAVDVDYGGQASGSLVDDVNVIPMSRSKIKDNMTNEDIVYFVNHLVNREPGDDA